MTTKLEQAIQLRAAGIQLFHKYGRHVVRKGQHMSKYNEVRKCQR